MCHFVTQQPPDAAIQVLTPIETSQVIENTLSWLPGVRVHASSNNKEALLGEVSVKPKDGLRQRALSSHGWMEGVSRTGDGELCTFKAHAHAFAPMSTKMQRFNDGCRRGMSTAAGSGKKTAGGGRVIGNNR